MTQVCEKRICSSLSHTEIDQDAKDFSPLKSEKEITAYNTNDYYIPSSAYSKCIGVFSQGIGI